MNKRFMSLVDAKSPKHNPRIVEGYAVGSMKLVEGYINRIIQSVAANFPPGLRYEGYSRCTPYEEDAFTTDRLGRQQSNANRGTLELAPSNMYLVRYRFSFQAPDSNHREELDPVYLYLPFVGDAGLLTIRGSTFSIFPVLTDRGISAGPDELFLRLHRVRLKFKAYLQHFMANGQRESTLVVWARIYQAQVKGVKLSVQAHTIIPLYMFCYYGATEAFKQFAKADVVIGDEMTVNAENYPADQWVICTSNFANHGTLAKPHGYKERGVYVAPTIRVAVPKAQYTQSAINMVAGFFYLADHFPRRILPAYIDDQRLWLVILGLLLFGDSKSEGKIVEEMTAHMKALVDYMDLESKLQLRAADIVVDDIFELLHMLMETFQSRINETQSEFSNLNDKRLCVLSEVLKDISHSFTHFLFKVTSPKKKALTAKDINFHLRFHLKPTLAMEINQGHAEVTSVSTPGDNKYFRITSQVALQTDVSPSGKGGRKKSVSIEDPSNYLHASVAYVGSYSTMSKADATGRRKLNPYVLTNENDLIIPNPELEDILTRTQAQIKRRN